MITRQVLFRAPEALPAAYWNGEDYEEFLYWVSTSVPGASVSEPDTIRRVYVSQPGLDDISLHVHAGLVVEGGELKRIAAGTFGGFRPYPDQWQS